MRKIFVILTLCLVCLTGCQVKNEIIKTENPINVEQLNAEIVEELEKNSSSRMRKDSRLLVSERNCVFYVS